MVSFLVKHCFNCLRFHMINPTIITKDKAGNTAIHAFDDVLDLSVDVLIEIESDEIL